MRYQRRSLLVRGPGFGFAILAGSGPLLRVAQAASAAPLARLRLAPDEVLLMRHADAPGFSDPDGFRLDDCATQRNLGDLGRAQARALGRWLRAEGLAPMEVWTSPWCRCVDTARLLDLGEPQAKAFLGSFFRERERADEHTRQLRDALAMRIAARPPRPLIAVTHQVNISAYAGAALGSGEVLRVRLRVDGSPRETARIEAG